MNEYKIMVVDDEPDILDLLEKALNIEGFNHIIKVNNGLEAVSACKEDKPDVIILDVMLPDIDGYEICKQIRQFSHCPILFLSSKNDELDKILGLAVGGDDYVTKPFSVMELMARVRAQLRRYEQPVSNKISLGSISINTDTREVFVNGEEVKLTFKEYELLVFLVENGNKVVSRDELLNKIWGYEYTGETRTIDIHIKTLRQKLGTAGDYIKTIRGMGYRAVKE